MRPRGHGGGQWPRVGFTTSDYGRDYRVGYAFGMLENEHPIFQLGVDAQRRESTLAGGTSRGLLGCASVGVVGSAENRMRRRAYGTGELPSVSLTKKFLALCHQYGAERLAVRIVAVGRSTGVAGLPETDDWTAWDADEMWAAVEYLQRKRGG